MGLATRTKGKIFMKSSTVPETTQLTPSEGNQRWLLSTSKLWGQWKICKQRNEWLIVCRLQKDKKWSQCWVFKTSESSWCIAGKSQQLRPTDGPRSRDNRSGIHHTISGWWVVLSSPARSSSPTWGNSKAYLLRERVNIMTTGRARPQPSGKSIFGRAVASTSAFWTTSWGWSWRECKKRGRGKRSTSETSKS